MNTYTTCVAAEIGLRYSLNINMDLVCTFDMLLDLVIDMLPILYRHA